MIGIHLDDDDYLLSDEDDINIFSHWDEDRFSRRKEETRGDSSFHIGVHVDDD